MTQREVGNTADVSSPHIFFSSPPTIHSRPILISPTKPAPGPGIARPVVHLVSPEVSVRAIERGTERGTKEPLDYTMRWQSFTVGSRSVTDQILAAPSARIVKITISVATTREDEQREWFVIERTTVCGPVYKADWLGLLPESAGQESAADNSAAKGWQTAISNWSAKKLEEPAWKQYTECWHLSERPGMAAIADGLGNFQNQAHKLLLGQPVQFASDTADLSPRTGAVLSGIASEHPLPGDALIKDLKRAVQITGIVAGFATGDLHMAHACLASYTRDRVTQAVSQEVAKLFTPQAGESIQHARSAEPNIQDIKPRRNSTTRLGAEPDTRPPGIGEAPVNWRQGHESKIITKRR